jgi:hypothetical protein
MCLIASHERLAFICDGCGKYQAIVFRQRCLQRRQWQIWQLGCEVNLTEKMFEIRDSLWLLEKQIAMGFANDVLVGPSFVPGCAGDSQKLSN